MANDHVLRLGKLLGNLQSLECMLRFYLLKRDKGALSLSYWALQVGDEIPSDAFSNYDSLGKMLDKFNVDVASRDAKLKLDPSVVAIRDLLAHGRVAADKEDTSRLRIVKFGLPSGGKVQVVASAVMSDDWFDPNIALVYEQVVKVGKALELA